MISNRHRVCLSSTPIMADSESPSHCSNESIRLTFSSTAVEESGKFRLLELPPDLLKLIEPDNNSPLTWAIKGNPAEDAVLCTNDKTYSIRSVSLSNSVLVVGPGEAQDTIFIRDTNREILQVAPILPKVHKLVGLLRGREYDEGREDLDDDILDGEQVRPSAYSISVVRIQVSNFKGEKGLSHLCASIDRNTG